MFGKADSDRKMIAIRLPFISIYFLNKKATDYWYEVGRNAFNDPDWFVENHHAVRQAKRKATLRSHRLWVKTHDELRAQYQKQIDDLLETRSEQSRKINEMSRDIDAYRKLIGGGNG